MIEKISSAAIAGIKTVGRQTIQGTNKARTYLANKADVFKKTNLAQGISKNKELIVGSGVVAAALALAGGCVKGIVDKIKDFNNKTKND